QLNRIQIIMDNFLWVEEFRPKTVADCILVEPTKEVFQGFVDDGQIPNLLLSGGAGVGKTTVAKAMCDEIGLDHLMVNGSNEGRNIDTVRTTLTQYCSSVSMGGGRKVVIVDEADYMNAESVQPALRGFIEKFSANVSFIFTCNFRNRIIDPIHSRCSVIEFVLPRTEKPKLAEQCLERVKGILTEKNIQFEEKVLVELIMKHFPDMRRVLNELQRYSAGGVIDAGILAQIGEINLNELMKALKEKHFSEVRKWVTQNIDNDPVKIFRKIYDGVHSHLKSTSIPQAVLIIADYQYKSAFVADQEINLVACLTEMMVDCEFK
ncbi:MAG: AAA family ATPase, partial [Candidatus Thermoplasmatota archaeon]|nr:AAA family ATPase [Candidatus Thermoplasmatota archaeon]